MLTKRVIACLDVRGGRVVKGVQFVDIVDAGTRRSWRVVMRWRGRTRLCCWILPLRMRGEGRCSIR